MPTHPITAELLRTLTIEAHATWYGFLNEASQYFVAGSLLEPRELSRRGFNPCLVRFVKFCDARNGSPKIGLELRDEPPATTAERSEDAQYETKSWLEPRADRVYIVIRKAPRAPETAREQLIEQRTWTKLVLHELVHIGRHLNVMLKDAKTYKYPRPLASPQHEAEAWVWTMTVIGLCMAEADYEARRMDLKTYGNRFPPDPAYGQKPRD